MKKIILAAFMLTLSISYSQKKPNGTVYINHPAIVVVEAYTKAINDGDLNKIDDFLADDFRAFSATTGNQFNKGLDKSSYLNRIKSWRESIEYFSIKTAKGAYPDAIEYKDDNQKDVVWVQTWDELKGVHTKTGVKVNMNLQRTFVINKANKIKTIYIYDNPLINEEIYDSETVRTNGTIYNHHQNINNVKNMLFAFEQKDLNKSYSYFTNDARFADINSMDNKSLSLDEQKAIDKKVLDAFDIVGLEVIGYPDYMHYELGDNGVVYSWWRWHLIRKSDKKEIALPVHYQHNIDKDGKIIREMAYYNAALLK
ncbi:nuclear transport factor 2 family protein [Flavobacterium cellulosilyticum]|uniref:Nuclear transport factor 2 family protein n=1 Tax=Flavobacterium cellulosilyticum TaxID=2541731 RepID=A0A4R5CG87_9FLAO|nr:nuclear transport factor 2 family protein [Flavobacterium cellulosilyticum]TDD98026.1 nuclear transport factor 2 family protein [Flavobacterium cellulosilyticum]